IPAPGNQRACVVLSMAEPIVAQRALGRHDAGKPTTSRRLARAALAVPRVGHPTSDVALTQAEERGVHDMHTAVIPPASTAPHGAYAVQPSFLGIWRGEVLKVSRQGTTWLLALLLAGAICLPYLVTLGRGSALKALIERAPLAYLYREMGSGLFVLRVFAGPLLIV